MDAVVETWVCVVSGMLIAHTRQALKHTHALGVVTVHDLLAVWQFGSWQLAPAACNQDSRAVQEEAATITHTVEVSAQPACWKRGEKMRTLLLARGPLLYNRRVRAA